jgi:hypothetical protein
MSEGHIYLLLNPGVKESKEGKHVIKIGKTVDINKRLNAHKVYDLKNLLMLTRVPSDILHKVEQDLIKNFNEHFEKHSGIEWYDATDDEVNSMVLLYMNIVGKHKQMYNVINNKSIPAQQIKQQSISDQSITTQRPIKQPVQKIPTPKLSLNTFIDKHITYPFYDTIIKFIRNDTQEIPLKYFSREIIKMLYEIIYQKYDSIIKNYSLDMDTIHNISSILRELYVFKKYTQIYDQKINVNTIITAVEKLLITTIYKYDKHTKHVKYVYESKLKEIYTCRKIELFKNHQRIFCQVPPFIDEKNLAKTLANNPDDKIKRILINYINAVTDENKFIWISKPSFMKTISNHFISTYQQLNDYANNKPSIGNLIKLIVGIMDCIALKDYLTRINMDQNILTIESIDARREKYNKLLDTYISNKKSILANIK